MSEKQPLDIFHSKSVRKAKRGNQEMSVQYAIHLRDVKNGRDGIWIFDRLAHAEIVASSLKHNSEVIVDFVGTMPHGTPYQDAQLTWYEWGLD